MDDDVQACLDTPLSHINGGGISFVVPDPDSNSSGMKSLKILKFHEIELSCILFFGEEFYSTRQKNFFQ